ncbi:MAG: hypothetical protein ABIP13_07170, partial [Tepidiformaceae bacterium]
MRITVTSPVDFGAAACRELLALVGDFEAPLIGLATGNTPIPLYQALASRVAAGEVSLRRFRQPVAIDEYVVREHA